MSQFESPRDEVLYRLATGSARVEQIGDLSTWGGVYLALGQITAGEIAERHAQLTRELGVPTDQFSAGTFWVIREDGSDLVTVYEHADADGYHAALNQARTEFEAFEGGAP